MGWIARRQPGRATKGTRKGWKRKRRHNRKSSVADP
jgi:hypothetical protein